MKSITKDEFLQKYSQGFDGNDDDGFVYKTVSFSFSEFKRVCHEAITSLSQLTMILENPNENEELLMELNNSTMSQIFGDGDSFQASFEEKSGSGDFYWYLDFGNFKVNSVDQLISYGGVRFYQG